VDNVKSGGNAVVEKFATQRKKVSPPLLHSIDTLQEQANKKFGFSSKQTLDLAQSLYEKHKATTYPRSDCQYLPISQLSEVKDVMTAISNIDSNMGKLIVNADLTVPLNIFLRLTSVTNWCAFFIALINAPSLYLAGGFVCLT
jgi:DNA topoisomerase IA